MSIPSSRRTRRTVFFVLLILVFLGLIGGSVILLRRGLSRSNLYAEAVALFEKGDRKGAEAKLRDALAANPSDLGSRAYLIQILMDDKRFDEAEALARELTKQRDTSMHGWKLLSEVAFRRMNFGEALRLAGSVSDQDPSFPQRMALQINDALGSPRNRTQALQAAINLVPLTESAQGKASLLIYGAETILDLRMLERDARMQEGMDGAARDYLKEAARILQASPDWTRDAERTRTVMARIEILTQGDSPEARDARERGERRLLSALERDAGSVDLHAALAAAFTRQGRTEDAAKQIRALEAPRAFLFWLRAVQRVFDAGHREMAATLLSRPPIEGNALVDLLRARALLAGDPAARTAGIALLMKTAQTDAGKTEIGLEAARILSAAGAWEEAQNLLGALDTSGGDVRLQAEMARAMLMSKRDTERASALVSRLAGAVGGVPESMQVLGILQSAGSPEAVRTFLDKVVERLGDKDPSLHVRRAATYGVFAQQEKDPQRKQEFRAQALGDLQAVLALPSADKQLLMAGWTLAEGLKEHQLAGAFFGRAAGMAAEPYEVALLTPGLVASLSEPASRSEFAAGVRGGAGPEDKALRSVIADLIEAGGMASKDLLPRLRAVAQVPQTRVATLLWILRTLRQDGDLPAWHSLVDTLFKEYPTLRVAREHRGEALLDAKSYDEVLRLHAGNEPSPRELVQRRAALIALQRIPDAMEESRAFMRAHPQDPTGFLSLADLHDDSGDKRAALGVLSAAPSPTRDIALSRAKLMAQLGELITAEKMYLGMIQASRGADPATWEGLGTVLLTAKRYQDLANISTNMLSTGTDQLPAEVRTKLHSLRGMAREGLNDLEGALADYDEAIRLGTKEVAPYNNAAWLRVQLGRGDFDVAWTNIQKAVELVPEAPAVRHTAAMVLKMGGQLEKALAELDRAIELQGQMVTKRGVPPKAEYMVDRAVVLDALNRREEAIQQLEAVLRDFPGSPGAERAAALRVRMR